MKNIWYIFGTVVILSVILLIVAIIFFMRKDKYYILKDLVIIAIVAFCLISDIPYIKDIVRQDTTEVVAVYVEYQTGNVHPGARRLFFENEEGKFNLLAATITREHVKMEVGKIYRIEYFNNSKVIKDYILIE